MNKKEIIRDTAQKLFAQFGLKKVTTDDIAQTAHISKATIYRYYNNKVEIFNEVVRKEADELLSALIDAVDAQDQVIDKFKAHLKVRIEKIHQLVNFYRVTQETWGDFWPHLAEIGQWFTEQEQKIVRDIMILGNTTGEFDIKQVDLAAYVTVTTLKSIELPWALGERGITAEEYVDIMIDMMINGIGKSKTGRCNEPAGA